MCLKNSTNENELLCFVQSRDVMYIVITTTEDIKKHFYLLVNKSFFDTTI
jgi:hypothetical protein